MQKANVEEVNGVVMLVLPLDIVDSLHLSSGSEVEVALQDRTLLVANHSVGGEYRLDDLLDNSDPAAFERTEEDWEFFNSPPVGRELL